MARGERWNVPPERERERETNHRRNIHSFILSLDSKALNRSEARPETDILHNSLSSGTGFLWIGRRSHHYGEDDGGLLCPFYDPFSLQLFLLASQRRSLTVRGLSLLLSPQSRSCLPASASSRSLWLSPRLGSVLANFSATCLDAYR
jgi:hypothetical protein